MITPYREQPDGRLEPDIPSTGPCGATEDGACRLARNHIRKRKTGPRFPLTVMRCRPHRRGFTLYPPGHVPYGREAIAPVSCDGGKVHSEPDSEPWSATVFEVALDAEEGKPWVREASGGAERWWSTQGRRLERLVRWFALEPATGARQQQAIADVLVVALLLLIEQAQQIARRPGYRSRGSAVCAILAALTTAPVVADRLAAAGYLAGLWGRPHRWDAGSGVLRSLPYRLPETRAPPAA